MNTEKQAFQMQSVRTVFLFHLLQGCFFFIRYTRPASNRHQQCIAKLERLGRVKWRQKTLSVLIWRRFRQSAGSCSDRLISAEKAFFYWPFLSFCITDGPNTRQNNLNISHVNNFSVLPKLFFSFSTATHFNSCAV